MRLLLILLSLFCALPAQLGAQEATLAVPVKRLLRATCFEVVVRRPDESKDQITYEKELPWDLVPYNIRKDPFVSIGTAFAVSKTELITAHHVLQSLQASWGFQTAFIRDADQNVFEIDQIQALDEPRDVVRFTVKGRAFNEWLEIRRDFQPNETVFTVGNAYGEGIVIRPGELIGTVPEPLNGEWNLLKSSASVNPGNSGGPLVDPAGKVVGVVLQKKDNICYSLPTIELQALKASTAHFYTKMGCSFILFPERTKALERAFDVPLPRPFAELRKEVANHYVRFYTKAMDGLFSSLGTDLFPGNESSDEAIQDIPTSSNPEVVFRNKDTKKWGISELEYKSSDLGKNGWIRHAEAAGVYFFNIRRPDDVSLATLIQNPKIAMDLLLKGVRITRTVGGEAIRITSFGKPTLQEPYADRYGRPWEKQLWYTPYDDGVVLCFTALTPNGVVMVAKFIQSTQLVDWEYDMPKILDYTYLPYSGQLKHWREYIQFRDKMPEALRSMAFQFQEKKSLKLEALWARLDLDQKSAEITDGAYLGLCMGYARKDGKVVWDLRRVVFDDEDENNYFVLLKHLRPTDSLSDATKKEWRDVARRRHPYTEAPFGEDGGTRIAATIPPLPGGAGPVEERDALCTLYLVRVGKVEEGEMKQRLKRLMGSVGSRN
jgi:hypothetical protein